MPKASQTTAGRAASGPGYEGRFDELGDYTIAFEQFTGAATWRRCSAACPTTTNDLHKTTAS